MVTKMTLGEPAVQDASDGEFYLTPVSPAERLQRYGHRPAVVVARSPLLRKALERALFGRGAAVAALETLPAKAQLRELLTNGLIVLAPFSAPFWVAELEGVDWIEAAEAASINESVRLTLRELERVGLLVSRKFGLPGGGI